MNDRSTCLPQLYEKPRHPHRRRYLRQAVERLGGGLTRLRTVHLLQVLRWRLPAYSKRSCVARVTSTGESRIIASRRPSRR